MMYVAHVALAVQDHGARHSGHLIERTDLAGSIEQNRETHRCGLEEPECVARFGLDVDAQQREACRLVLAVQLLEHRHFLAARAAPAGPEVNQYHLTLEL